MAKIRKGNPKIADKIDTSRTLRETGPNRSSISQLKKSAAKSSATAAKSNPNSATYKASVANASDSRLQARHQSKPSVPTKGAPAASPSNRRFSVTRDNRPEAKGNYSGVDVNGKGVRKGKVVAAERMVGKSIAKMAAKRAVPYVGTAITGAELGYTAGKSLRKAVDSHKDSSFKKSFAKKLTKLSKEGK